MRALLQAIYSRYTDSAGLSGLVTGLYFDEAPQNTALPYMRYTIISDTTSKVFGLQDKEDVLIQFDIFSDDSSVGEAMDIYDALVDVYDDCELDVDGYSFVGMTRELVSVDRTDDSPRVWMIQVQYRVIISE